MSLESRFWAKVDKRGPVECWVWTGATNEHGYGVLHAEGRRNGGTLKAHRVAVALDGRNLDGLCVLHECDNPPCINPAHLRVGTKADNTRDMLSKHRGLVGRRNGQAKLNETEAAEIRRRRNAGEPRKRLAAEFDVSGATITRIANREGWRHVA